MSCLNIQIEYIEKGKKRKEKSPEKVQELPMRDQVESMRKFKTSLSEKAFIPFLNERDNLGRLISNDPNSSTTRRRRKNIDFEALLDKKKHKKTISYLFLGDDYQHSTLNDLMNLSNDTDKKMRLPQISQKIHANQYLINKGPLAVDKAYHMKYGFDNPNSNSSRENIFLASTVKDDHKNEADSFYYSTMEVQNTKYLPKYVSNEANLESQTDRNDLSERKETEMPERTVTLPSKPFETIDLATPKSVLNWRYEETRLVSNISNVRSLKNLHHHSSKSLNNGGNKLGKPKVVFQTPFGIYKPNSGSIRKRSQICHILSEHKTPSRKLALNQTLEPLNYPSYDSSPKKGNDKNIYQEARENLLKVYREIQAEVEILVRKKEKRGETNREELLKNRLIYSALQIRELNTEELELGLLSLKKKIKEAQRQLMDVRNS